MLNCTKCGAMGTVNEPSNEEWSEAFHAPSKPYNWTDNARVTLRQSGPVYVERAPGSGRSGRIIVPETPLTLQERDELKVLEDVVIKAELDGGLFPLYIRHFENDTGAEPTGAVKRLAARIKELVGQRRKFTPAMMAIVIREYVRESEFFGNGND